MLRTALFALALSTGLFTTSQQTAPDTVPAQRPALVDMAQVKCLAEVVYHEARGESVKAQRAVAAVVMARAKASGQPPCKVAAKPKQFSGLGKPMHDAAAAEIAADIAHAVYVGEGVPFEATHFHDTSVSPYWAKKMQRVAQVGKLVFYA
jgi:spore germination cell wall hydrolase CwlJ-like protein